MTTPLTDSEIKAIMERCEKATPGPWESEVTTSGGSILTRGGKWRGQSLQVVPSQDADFIASARSDVPDLCRDLLAAREVMRRIRCPRDTDADGNCGRHACPYCGIEFRKALEG